MKLEVKFNYEQIDQLVIESLKDSIDSLIVDIVQFYAYDTLPPQHKIEDFKRSKKHLKHLIKTYNYYTLKEEQLDYKIIMKSLKEGKLI
jgi:hypothetical protein